MWLFIEKITGWHSRFNPREEDRYGLEIRPWISFSGSFASGSVGKKYATKKYLAAFFTDDKSSAQKLDDSNMVTGRCIMVLRYESYVKIVESWE